jgi:hypothetical protein
MWRPIGYPIRWTAAPLRPYWRPSSAPSYQAGPTYVPPTPAYAPSYQSSPVSYAPSYPQAQPSYVSAPATYAPSYPQAPPISQVAQPTEAPCQLQQQTYVPQEQAYTPQQDQQMRKMRSQQPVSYASAELQK